MSTSTKPTTIASIPVVLVITVPPSEREFEHEREQELRSLCDTSHRTVVHVISQHLPKPVSATYIGSGKIQELKTALVDHAAHEAVFDVQLSPRQQRNLEKELEADVLDYNQLILDIFSVNAHTHQAKLAVELASLEYNRSRLKRLWSHLDRVGGGGGGGSSAVRGTGEKQIEIDKRLVRDRISELKKQLEQIESRRERTVAARGECYNIALVGYTNAGKSTLMNALTRVGVLAENRLFATLDTRTARLHLDGVPNAVLSDTVGFIRNLPPGLIASFHATLAEVREADLLLHVVDAGNPGMDEQIAAVDGVLKGIEASAIPTVMVFNKIDAAASRTLVDAYRRRHSDAVAISARTGEGLDALRATITARAAQRRERLHLRFSAADGQLQAFLRRRTVIVEESYDGDDAILVVDADPRLKSELVRHPGLIIDQAVG